MIDSHLMISFRAEVEKTAAMPPLPVVTGAIGAAVAGGKALKYVADEHTHDQFLNDMGLMGDDVWKKRRARRRNLVLGATVAGGAGGAALPFVARFAGRKLKEKVVGAAPQAKAVAGQAVEAGAGAAGEVAGRAGRRFTEEAVDAFKQHASDIGKRMGEGFQEGSATGAKTVAKRVKSRLFGG